jgi:hypothetical protein
MTIDEAVLKLINSDSFKEKARHEAKLRVYLGRINKGTANKMIKIDLLEAFGYAINVKTPSKKK